MRLIDTDEILTRIQKAYVDTEFETDKRAIAINIGLTKALNNVQDCKKFELKRGEWKTVYLPHKYMGCRPTAYYCSECNQITTFRTFYCPNCGADMRGETDG